MKKKYIFITTNVHPVGGAQSYLKNKINYLEQNGWEVYVFFAGSCEKGCAFPELERFVDGGIEELGVFPCQIVQSYGTVYYNVILFQMLRHIHYDKKENCSYLIESSHEYEAIWGELLARQIKAKHICFSIHERFRGDDRHYVDYIDFFKWKYARRELAGIEENSIKMLFDGYMNVEDSKRFKLSAIMDYNIKEIKSQIIEELPKKEWNIAYFGRCQKEYFPNIVDGVEQFALEYPMHDMQFVIVGSIDERQKEILERLNGFKNLTVTIIGYFSVIPKSLFQKIDVFIAGSGCAYLSALQGVPTIVADARNYQAMGILGYTTTDTLYGDQKYSYQELLKAILVEKYCLKTNKMKIPDYDSDEAHREFFEFVKASEQQKSYYPFVFPDKEKDKDDYFGVMEYFLKIMIRNQVERECFASWIKEQYGEKIGLFGVGMCGKRLLKAIPELRFSYIYDNNVKQYENRTITLPNNYNINYVEMLVISPIAYQNDIAKQMRELEYEGKQIGIVDLIKQYVGQILKEE